MSTLRRRLRRPVKRHDPSTAVERLITESLQEASDTDAVTCSVCRKLVSLHKGGLRKHIEKAHADRLDDDRLEDERPRKRLRGDVGRTWLQEARLVGETEPESASVAQTFFPTSDHYGHYGAYDAHDGNVDGGGARVEFFCEVCDVDVFVSRAAHILTEFHRVSSAKVAADACDNAILDYDSEVEPVSRPESPFIGYEEGAARATAGAAAGAGEIDILTAAMTAAGVALSAATSAANDDDNDGGVLGAPAVSSATEASSGTAATAAAMDVDHADDRDDNFVYSLPVVVPSEGALASEESRDFTAWAREHDLTVRAVDDLALGVKAVPALTSYKMLTALDKIVSSTFHVVKTHVTVPFDGVLYSTEMSIVSPRDAILFLLSMDSVRDSVHMMPLVEPAFEHAASPFFCEFYDHCCAAEAERGTELPVRVVSLSAFADGAAVCKFVEGSVCPVSISIINQNVSKQSTLMSATCLLGYIPKDTRFKSATGRRAPNKPDFRRCVSQAALAAVLSAVPLRIVVNLPGVGHTAVYVCHPLLRGDLLQLASFTGIYFLGTGSKAAGLGCACSRCTLPIREFPNRKLGEPRTVRATLAQSRSERLATGHSEVNAASGSPLYAFVDTLQFDVFQGLAVVDRLHNLDLGIGRLLVSVVLQRVIDADGIVLALKSFRKPSYEGFLKIPSFPTGKRFLERGGSQTGAHTHGLLLFFAYTISGQQSDKFYSWDSAATALAALTTLRRYFDFWHLISSPPTKVDQRESYLADLRLQTDDLVLGVSQLCPEQAGLPKLHALLHLPELVERFGSALIFELGASERRLQEFAGGAYAHVSHIGDLAPRLLQYVLRLAVVRHPTFASLELRERLYKVVDEPRLQEVRPDYEGVSYSTAAIVRLSDGAAVKEFGEHTAAVLRVLYAAMPDIHVQRSRSALVGADPLRIRVVADDHYRDAPDGTAKARFDDVVWPVRGTDGKIVGHHFGRILACYTVWYEEQRYPALLVERFVPLLTKANEFALHRALGVIGLVRYDPARFYEAAIAKDCFSIVEDFASVRMAHFLPALQPLDLQVFHGAVTQLYKPFVGTGAQLVRSVLGGMSSLISVQVEPTNPVPE